MECVFQQICRLSQGGTQVWFWCATAEFESRPIQIPIFQEKVTHSYTNLLNFGPNFEQNHPDFPKIFLNLNQFWLKFGKILKNWPIHILNFTFYKGSFPFQEADFATHVDGPSPKGLLYWVPLPGAILYTAAYTAYTQAIHISSPSPMLPSVIQQVACKKGEKKIQQIKGD